MKRNLLWLWYAYTAAVGATILGLINLIINVPIIFYREWVESWKTFMRSFEDD